MTPRSITRPVLAIALAGLATAASGCSAGSATTEQVLTVNYVQDGTPVSTPVTITGVSCQISDASSIYSSPSGDSSFNAVIGAVNGEKTYTVSVKMSESLGFFAANEYTVTDTGLEFDQTSGRVGTLDGVEVSDLVDPDATLTGTITCDS